MSNKRCFAWMPVCMLMNDELNGTSNKQRCLPLIPFAKHLVPC